MKLTDAKRYLKRRSDHSPHTFKAMSYSQFIGVVIICSYQTDREENIGKMFQKFKNGGYDELVLEVAKSKTLPLNRDKTLEQTEYTRNKLKLPL